MYTVRKSHVLRKSYPTNEVKAVVLHVDLGTYVSTYNTINGVASASYHDYVRSDKNEIVEYIPTNRGAWHAGKRSGETSEVKRVFGAESANRQSYGLCYSGRPVDAQGNVNWDWSKVVNGERATDEQVDMAARRIIDKGYDKLPIFAHVELTSYKPKIVLDFKARVLDRIKELQKSEETGVPVDNPDAAQIAKLKLWIKILTLRLNILLTRQRGN